MTDYEWECRERAKQRERFMVYRKSRNFMNLPEDPSNLGYDFIEDDENDRMKKFNFMTTVSIPVYDKRENAVRKLLNCFEKLSNSIEGIGDTN
jgi:voltage-dependent calcium channel alpha-2/delta-3